MLLALPWGPARGAGSAGAGAGAGLIGGASWRVKWANRCVAGAHAVVSSTMALAALASLARECGGAGVAAPGWCAAPGAGPTSWLLPRGLGYEAALPPRGSWWEHGGVLEVTLAYTLADALYMALLEPGLAFLLHHLAIASCFAPLFTTDRGFVVAVVGVAVAELANPLLGAWTWAKENLRANPGLSPAEAARHQAAFGALSLPVTASYAATRGVAMPLSVLDVARVLFAPRGGRATPGLAWVWVHCVAGLLGSLAWIRMLVTGYARFRAKERAARGEGKAKKGE